MSGPGVGNLVEIPPLLAAIEYDGGHFPVTQFPIAPYAAGPGDSPLAFKPVRRPLEVKKQLFYEYIILNFKDSSNLQAISR